MELFGAAHLVMLAGVGAMSAGLAMAARGRPHRARLVRWTLSFVLAGNELVWYAFRYLSEGFRFPEALPLHLCDLSLWLTVVALFSLRPLVSEVAYFGGLGGSGIALLTPDLWAPFPSYPTIYFFVSHGLVVISVATLGWGRILPPRRGSWGKAYVLLNLYTGAVALFNFWFGTNYMYLRAKPENASLLDYFGPWPVYVLVADGFALGVFLLLGLPWGIWPTRGARQGPGSQSGANV